MYQILSQSVRFCRLYIKKTFLCVFAVHNGFSVQSGFISRSVHARLQASVCSGYDVCHPG